MEAHRERQPKKAEADMGTEIFRETGGDGVGRATPSPGGPNDLQTRRAVEGPVKTAPRHSTETFGKEKNALTSALGWFSVGLGAAELLAPATVARVIGVDPDENRGLLRVFGLRELIAGVGILTRP